MPSASETPDILAVSVEVPLMVTTPVARLLVSSDTNNTSLVSTLLFPMSSVKETLALMCLPTSEALIV